MTEREQEAANQMRREVLGCTCGKPKVRLVMNGGRFEIQAYVCRTVRGRWPWRQERVKWEWVMSGWTDTRKSAQSAYDQAVKNGAGDGFIILEEKLVQK